MRKVIIILILLISINSFGQVFTSGSRWWNGEYNTRCLEFFARVDSAGKTLTDIQKVAYGLIFNRLLSNGIIGTTRADDSLVFAYVMWKDICGDSTIAKMNILDTSYTLSTIGTVYWTDSGVVSNGTTGYLKTGFNPSDDSSIMKLNSASLGIFSLTDTNLAKTDIGCMQDGDNKNSVMVMIRSGNLMTGRLNNLNAVLSQSFIFNSKGLFACIRRESDSLIHFANGFSTGNLKCVSSALPDKEVIICAYNYGTIAPTTRVYPYAFAGSGLSDSKLNSLYDIFNDELRIFGYTVLSDSRDTVFQVAEVKQDGTGDYTTIQSIFTPIVYAHKSSPRYALIYPGSYNEMGIQVRGNYFNLVGTDKNTCIINGYQPYDTTEAALTATSTIEWGTRTYNISNLTITVRNGRYCIHEDAEGVGLKTLTNCILIHYGNDSADTYHGKITGSNHAFGHGWANYDTIICTNVDFIGSPKDESRGFFSHTATGVANPNLFILNNCNFSTLNPVKLNSHPVYIGYYKLNGDLYYFNNCICDGIFFVRNDVDCGSNIILTNTTYDSLICNSGGTCITITP